ncbi:MAG TPA: nucleoside hydrolase [Ktedonobacterales bacterium]|jgi:inosine-uridine nucleoside N-ribohydrolase|nr:nucleoside hydrolase [Ktedonobacterales bacterium]
MVKLHLDTDIGGDMDDLCALAMLLSWRAVMLTGITTAAEAAGRRAGYVAYVLALANRTEIPFAAGADATAEIGYRLIPTYHPDELLWPEPVAPRPGPIEDALELMKASVDAGAVLVGTGPFTNFRLLEARTPGILARARIVLMGGCPFPPRAGLPPWGQEEDYNFQADPVSSLFVLAHAQPLVVPLSLSLETALRGSDLPALRQAGSLGALLAYQAERWLDVEPQNAALAREYDGLPDDFINFHHDPLACAVGAGWDGVTIESHPFDMHEQDGNLVERAAPDGPPRQCVTSVDAQRFNRFWLECITSHV